MTPTSFIRATVTAILCTALMHVGSTLTPQELRTSTTPTPTENTQRVHSVGTWSSGTMTWASNRERDWGAIHGSAILHNTVRYQQIRFGGASKTSQHSGRGVTVAVIDTGVDFTHPFLREKLDTNAAWDFVDDDALPEEVLGRSFSGHGTAVAGIINQIAPNATILPLRVLGADGNGASGNVAKAIRHAVDHGAHVINLSLGSTERKEPVMQAIAHATARGVIVVCSVGNKNQERADYPAAEAPSTPLLISVGSVNATDVKSRFSNYGDTEVNANGEQVATSFPAGTTYATGTSFAAPQVSGLIAVALAQGRTPRQIETALVNGADPIDRLAGNEGYTGKLGGRVNATKLLELSPRPRSVNATSGSL